VKLNVGGQKFMTTESTLNSKGTNFLTQLIKHEKEGKIGVLKDEEGYIFIDRNGKVFEIILEYLRTGTLVLSAPITQPQLDMEMEFYQIEGHKRKFADELICYEDIWKKIAKKWLNEHWSSMKTEIQKDFEAGRDIFRFYLIKSEQYRKRCQSSYNLGPNSVPVRILPSVDWTIRLFYHLSTLFEKEGFHMIYSNTGWGYGHILLKIPDFGKPYCLETFESTFDR